MTKVDAAIELDKTATEWNVEFTPAETIEFLEKLIPDNPDNHIKVGIIKAINDMIPPTEDNRVHHYFTVGSEGSRFIVLNVRKAYILKPFDYDALSKKLKTFGREFCDEYFETTNDQFNFSYRFWWD